MILGKRERERYLETQKDRRYWKRKKEDIKKERDRNKFLER